MIFSFFTAFALKNEKAQQLLDQAAREYQLQSQSASTTYPLFAPEGAAAQYNN